ncbi:MAG: MMPL family transporter [Aliivibrio sp.]|uniref:MMPL family transporter n=1 Tax=Aliivibrio sp. TaxID=1872443 RepID=UPI001A3663D9|nr:MMPL family transporter [Aliivibrio sp.]
MIVLLSSAILIGLFLQPNSPIETNILKLLPENRQNPIAQKAFEQVTDNLSDKVIFLLQQPHEQSKTVKLNDAADAFVAALNELPLFKQVTGTISAKEQQAWGDLYFPARAQLLTSEQQQRLLSHPEQQVQRVIKQVYNPFSGVTASELSEDPFLLFRDFMGQLNSNSSNIQLKDGYLTAEYENQQYIIVTATLASSPYQISSQQQLPQLQDVEATIKTEFSLDILHTGVIFYAAYGTQSAKSEVSTIGVGSLIGVIFIVLFIYRSTLPLFLALLSISTGLVVATVTTIVVFGKIHLFSMVFGASLIGVSIDYAFHYLTDRLAAGQSWNAQSGLKQIFTAILLGLITSLIGYLGMLIAPFPGLQQLSLFSSVGLVASFLCVICWYPILATAPQTVLNNHSDLPFSTLMNLWLQWWQKKSTRVWVPLVILLLSAVGLYHAKYDDDVRQLQAMPSYLIAQEQAVKTITGLDNSSQMLVVTSRKSEDDLLEQLALISEKLQLEVEKGTISSFQSISQFVPSASVQQQNYQLVKNLYQQQASLLGDQLGFKQTPLLLQSFKLLTIEDYLASSASNALQFMWLGQVNDVHAAVITTAGVKSSDALKAFAHNNGIIYLNKADEISQLFSQYRVKVSELLMMAFGAILVVMIWRYNVKRALLIVIPPAIAGCAGLAITVVTGGDLNLFNLLALLLILGIGIDYTLFFTEQKHEKSTLLAVTLSSVTTILSFGLLALSETQAIHSFGVTVLVGIMVAWFLAPLSKTDVNPHNS